MTTKIEFRPFHTAMTVFLAVLGGRLGWAFANWVLTFFQDSPHYYPY